MFLLEQAEFTWSQSFFIWIYHFFDVYHFKFLSHPSLVSRKNPSKKKKVIESIKTGVLKMKKRERGRGRREREGWEGDDRLPLS